MSISQQLELQSLIVDRFRKFVNPLLSKDNVVAGYYPIGSELNILPILEMIPSKILLPSIIEDSRMLKFYQWNPSDKLCSSKYASKILEPCLKQKEEIPDVVICPIVACDLYGNRLGSGRAMYDFTISNLKIINPNLLCIGICYDFQLIDELPAEEHDQKLDIILTENRLKQK